MVPLISNLVVRLGSCPHKDRCNEAANGESRLGGFLGVGSSWSPLRLESLCLWMQQETGRGLVADSILGFAGRGGGGKAHNGVAAGLASAAAAEASIGGQWAGKAGGADSHVGATGTGAAKADTAAAAAAAREGDATTGEARATEQRFRPTHQAASGAAHSCRGRVRVSYPFEGMGWDGIGEVEMGPRSTLPVATFPSLAFQIQKQNTTKSNIQGKTEFCHPQMSIVRYGQHRWKVSL